MRTIVSGTVNGVTFALKEDYKVVCKESKYCNLISESAKASLEKTQEKIKQGLYPTAVLVITEELEKLPEVEIRVNRFIKYQDNIEEIHYYHMPLGKSCAKMLYLKGRFKTEGKFTVLVDHTAQVIDPEGKVNKAYSNLLRMWIDDYAIRFTSPSIPSRNAEIYKVLKKEVPALQIEKVCFYHYPLIPGAKY